MCIRDRANDPNRRSVVISLQNKLILVNGTPESRTITRDGIACLLYTSILKLKPNTSKSYTFEYVASKFNQDLIDYKNRDLIMHETRCV